MEKQSEEKEKSQKIFDTFDPYPEWRVWKRKAHTFLHFLWGALLLSLVGGVEDGGDVWIPIITGTAGFVGTTYFVLILVTSCLCEAKKEKFAKLYPYHAKVLASQ